MRAVVARDTGKYYEYMRSGEIVLGGERAEHSIYIVDRMREDEKVKRQHETSERKRICKYRNMNDRKRYFCRS